MNEAFTMNKVLRAYKGFNHDMTCRGFQFEEGKTYHEDRAQLCCCGFHACEKPTDVFSYYPPFYTNGKKTSNRYHEVLLINPTSEFSYNSKRCAPTIKIGRELSIQEMVIEEYKRAVDKTRWAQFFIRGNLQPGVIFDDYKKRSKKGLWYHRGEDSFCCRYRSYNSKVLINIIEEKIHEKRMKELNKAKCFSQKEMK